MQKSTHNISVSRITAYLGVKILSLPKHENLTTGEKYVGNYSSFYNIFAISLTSRVQLHINLLNVVVRIIFPQFCKSDMSKYGYLEVFQRVPWNSK